MEAPKQNLDSVKGRFVREIYSNHDQDVIALYDLVDWQGSIPTDVEDSMRFIALGHLLPLQDVFHINFQGRWVNNPKREGEKQLKVATYSLEEPVTREGIIKVLSSGLYRGIGKRTAEKIFDMFGVDSLHVVTRQTHLLQQVGGIGPATIRYISESVRETVDLMELVAFLAVYDISMRKIKQIQKEFPLEPKKVIEQEPFNLCRIKGFSFEVVDEIAERLQTPLTSAYRIQSALSYVMEKSNGAGHLYTNKDELLKKATALLNKRAAADNSVPYDAVQAELQVMEMETAVVIEFDKEGNEIVYRYDDFRNESRASQRIHELMEARPDIRRLLASDALEQQIDEAEQVFEIKLSPRQREAVKMSLTENVCIITGGPGTGKTTILRIILYIYERIVEQSYIEESERPTVLLTAPTGKAARRMSESAGKDAYTIHKALGLNPGNLRIDMGETMLNESVGRVFLDEASMADMALAAKLLEELDDDCQVTFLGDVDQLPSVGPGSVLSDMIKSGVIPVTRLDVIYRQGETSLIAINAERMQAGNTELIYHNSAFAFFPIPPRNDEEAEDKLIDLYLRAAMKFGFSEAQILCPRRDTVVASAASFNKKIQKRLYGNDTGPVFKNRGTTYHIGERIIQTKNTTKAHNGDTGTIVDIQPDPGQKGSFIITVQFDFMDQGSTIDYYLEDFDYVQLGYAITIHRSQGSEYKAVFIPVLTSQMQMMFRNLLYTGVTRGKLVVVLAGQKAAITKAIQTDDTRERNSQLWVRIQDWVFA